MDLGLAGYNIEAVQAEVNRQLKTGKSSLKVDETIASETESSSL